MMYNPACPIAHRLFNAWRCAPAGTHEKMPAGRRLVGHKHICAVCKVAPARQQVDRAIAARRFVEDARGEMVKL